jgi:hypothetical protein
MRPDRVAPVRMSRADATGWLRYGSAQKTLDWLEGFSFCCIRVVKL